mgnify:CR=1 FL=1
MLTSLCGLWSSFLSVAGSPAVLELDLALHGVALGPQTLAMFAGAADQASAEGAGIAGVRYIGFGVESFFLRSTLDQALPNCSIDGIMVAGFDGRPHATLHALFIVARCHWAEIWSQFRGRLMKPDHVHTDGAILVLKFALLAQEQV